MAEETVVVQSSGSEPIIPLPSTELFEPPRIPRYKWSDIVGGDLQQEGDIVGNLSTDPATISEEEVTELVTYTFYEHSVSQATGKGIPATIVIDRSCTIQEVYLHVETAPGAGCTLTVDINKNGTTIFGTQANRPSITDTDTTATSGAPSVTSLNEDDEITMDIDTHDGASAKLSVYIRCQVN
jgi:hypothetical protein